MVHTNYCACSPFTRGEYQVETGDPLPIKRSGEIESILQDHFGFSSFKEGQKSIIEEIVSGRDVLGIMPTGAGKSLCFQAPALILEGTAVVISPLISLMKDQVDSLKEMGVRAAFINSSLPPDEMQSISAAARSGAFRLLYVAPERLELDGFRKLLSVIDVSLIAVDEAHCISQWGHDFRPSYRKIRAMIDTLANRPPIAAFTATATPKVKEDIINMLGLNNPYTLVTGFDRENLSFEVEKPDQKFSFLTAFLNENRSTSGIIYCSTRKAVESVSSRLNDLGFSSTRYHAGLSEEERAENQEAFINDRVSIICATVAFGMGIDKSNIRYVIHYNMPKTMENYYQEAGRAGRDGEAARCILLYSPADIITNKMLIAQSEESAARDGDYKKLQEIIDYCHTGKCLRRYILNYFGEAFAPEECGNCGNCLNLVDHSDITVEAQKIISCIKRTGERFGSGMIADVLRGSRSAKVKEMGFDNLSTFGLMPEYSKGAISEMAAYLVARGLVEVEGGQYPVLRLSRASYGWLKSGEPLMIKRLIKKEAALKTVTAGKTGERSSKKAALNELDGESRELFEKLRALRREIAEEQNVPPFVVFSDATLIDMCYRLPEDEFALLGVNGVGRHKQEKYGVRFLAVIREHLGPESKRYETGADGFQAGGDILLKE
jgi:ATP-dependent DNA helicase RecQ